jgi:hypothetical protein
MPQQTNLPVETVIELSENLEKLPESQEEKLRREAKELKDLKRSNYLINFKDRVEKWEAKEKGRGEKPIPLHWDSETKEWVWLNRAQRRYK